MSHLFQKSERIVSKKLIEEIFSGKDHQSKIAFPLRIVYMERRFYPADGSDTPSLRPTGEPPVAVLMSVSKRHFKHAVDRNRVKRQLREAYRKNKSELVGRMTAQHPGETLCVAFVWIDGRQAATSRVDYCMQQLLQRIGERL